MRAVRVNLPWLSTLSLTRHEVCAPSLLVYGITDRPRRARALRGTFQTKFLLDVIKGITPTAKRSGSVPSRMPVGHG